MCTAVSVHVFFVLFLATINFCFSFSCMLYLVDWRLWAQVMLLQALKYADLHVADMDTYHLPTSLASILQLLLPTPMRERTQLCGFRLQGWSYVFQAMLLFCVHFGFINESDALFLTVSIICYYVFSHFYRKTKSLAFWYILLKSLHSVFKQ